jgi:hypothetical protein
VSLAANVKKINFNLITICRSCWNKNTHSSLKNYRSNLFSINFIFWLTMSKYLKLDHLGYWKPETKPDMQTFKTWTSLILQSSEFGEIDEGWFFPGF